MRERENDGDPDRIGREPRHRLVGDVRQPPGRAAGRENAARQAGDETRKRRDLHQLAHEGHCAFRHEARQGQPEIDKDRGGDRRRGHDQHHPDRSRRTAKPGRWCSFGEIELTEALHPLSQRPDDEKRQHKRAEKNDAALVPHAFGETAPPLAEQIEHRRETARRLVHDIQPEVRREQRACARQKPGGKQIAPFLRDVLRQLVGLDVQNARALQHFVDRRLGLGLRLALLRQFRAFRRLALGGRGAELIEPRLDRLRTRPQGFRNFCGLAPRRIEPCLDIDKRRVVERSRPELPFDLIEARFDVVEMTVLFFLRERTECRQHDRERPEHET